jgi:hypothetical protein
MLTTPTSQEGIMQEASMQNLREAELELQISELSVELANMTVELANMKLQKIKIQNVPVSKLNVVPKLVHHHIKEGDKVRVGPGSKCHKDRRGTIVRLTAMFALVLDAQSDEEFKVAKQNCIKL